MALYQQVDFLERGVDDIDVQSIRPISRCERVGNLAPLTHYATTDRQAELRDAREAERQRHERRHRAREAIRESRRAEYVVEAEKIRIQRDLERHDRNVEVELAREAAQDFVAPETPKAREARLDARRRAREAEQERLERVERAERRREARMQIDQEKRGRVRCFARWALCLKGRRFDGHHVVAVDTVYTAAPEPRDRIVGALLVLIARCPVMSIKRDAGPVPTYYISDLDAFAGTVALYRTDEPDRPIEADIRSPEYRIEASWVSHGFRCVLSISSNIHE